MVDINQLDEPFRSVRGKLPSSVDIDIDSDMLSIVTTPTGQELVPEDTWDEVTTEYTLPERDVLCEASNPNTCPTSPPPPMVPA